MNEAMSWLFEKINKINKPLGKLIKLIKIETKNGASQQIILKLENNYRIFWNFIYHKIRNSRIADKFLDTYDLPKLNQGNINNLNKSMTSNRFEIVIVSQQRKS
jgi:hypothetical protein